MRVVLASMVVAGVLAGCSPPVPNDQDQYFDNINPDPTRLEGSQPSDVSTTGVTPAPQTVQPPVAVGENPEISNTQDFRAVTESETIASDAAKLAALKQQYKVVEPTALPTRSGEVNLASYALSQKQEIGTRTYRRSGNGGSNCGRYRNDPDGAQRAFLKAGGPARDRNRLDPDGDGFACGWNPNTYRRLVQSN